jgi:alpha-tubulin suppressor-like RCC1 family protein
VLDCGDAGRSGGDDASGSGGIDGGPNQDSGLPNPPSVSCRRLAIMFDASGALCGQMVCVLGADQSLQCSATPPDRGTKVQTIPTVSGARCISGGEDFTCAVTSAGGVACWGDLSFGDPPHTYAAAPVPVLGLASGVVDIAGGENHACVLLSTGAVQCWGSSIRWGEYNTTPNGGWPAAPTTVALGSPATAITAGDGFSCAIVAGGQIECWGSNQEQELGSAAAPSGMSPVPVMGLPAPAVGVWADQATSPCALLRDGSVWCWGLFLNMDIEPHTGGLPPTQQTGFAAPVQALTTGGEWGMSCALLTTGAVQCWGLPYASLGNGGGGQFSARPVTILPAGSGAIEIRSGDVDTCALLANGNVTCWGDNARPTPIPGL